MLRAEEQLLLCTSLTACTFFNLSSINMLILDSTPDCPLCRCRRHVTRPHVLPLIPFFVAALGASHLATGGDEPSQTKRHGRQGLIPSGLPWLKTPSLCNQLQRLFSAPNQAKEHIVCYIISKVGCGCLVIEAGLVILFVKKKSSARRKAAGHLPVFQSDVCYAANDGRRAVLRWRDMMLAH